VPTPILVVGEGGAGGEDNHLAGLIRESLEHHDLLPPWASPRATRSAAESLLPILCGV
jgi:hypothetical protein